MAKSSIMIDLADERSEKIAEVLSNKTSKKVLQALAEGEKCGSELASELKIPLNTISYNLKKLADAGLIEKSKRFFWSMKGKKMDYYRVVNKKIVIMPKQMIRGVLPAVGVAFLGAVGIRFWTQSMVSSGTFESSASAAGDESFVAETVARGVWAMEAAPQAITDGANGVAGLCANQTILNIAQAAWLWFLVGAFTALFVYLIWNWGRRR